MTKDKAIAMAFLRGRSLLRGRDRCRCLFKKTLFI